MSPNYLIQNTELDDIDEVITDAIDIIEESFEGGRGCLIPSSFLALALNEAAFEIIRIIIEEYYEEFLYEIKIESIEDITSEMLEITGERIPYISEFAAEQMFLTRGICFVRESGEVVNNPQTQLMGFRRRNNHYLLI